MGFYTTYFNEWTGTTSAPAGTKLLSKSGIWEGWLDPAVLVFTDADTGNTYSEERWIGLNVSGHTNIGSARVTKFHGTLKDGITLNAGTVTTFYTPKAQDAASTIATSAIPSDFKPTTGLNLAWDATTSEYQFGVLQYALSSADTMNPAQMEGNSGYALVQVAYPYQTGDPDAMTFPGGLAPESIYNRTGTMLFIKDDNDELQMLGCFQNEVSYNAAPEFSQLQKGAMNGTISYAYNARPNMITGNCYSFNGAVMKYFFGAEDRGSDGTHTEYYLGSTWSPVKRTDVWFLTYSDLGKEVLVKMPNAAMRATGEMPFGADSSMFAFEMQAPSSTLYISDNLYDVAYLALDFTVTTP